MYFKCIPSAPGRRRRLWFPEPVISQYSVTLFTSTVLDTDDTVLKHHVYK